MSSLLKLPGYHPHKYSGDGFSVEIKSLVGEGVLIIYTRFGVSLDLVGERTGKKWKAIQIEIPKKDGMTEVSRIALDLEAAFRAMGYEYDISSGLETLARSKELGKRY